MVRRLYLLTFSVVLVGASGYFYSFYQARCATPLTYALGPVDERFQLESGEAAQAVAEAVAVWEAALGIDVFTVAEPDEAVDFYVNFIFDERQARTDAESRERERLAAVAAQSEEVQAAYAEQVAELKRREASYERQLAGYERDLARYNQTVASYNDGGGAPADVFTELEAERQRLERQAENVDNELAALNQLVDEINQLGTAGNTLLSRYNDRVVAFNDVFADGREFTQGDWQGDRINIYSFADAPELHVVLVHELGHALGLDHVESPEAFMHYLLGEQDPEAALHPDDIAAYEGSCSVEARLATIPQPWRMVFAWLDSDRGVY